MKLEDMLVASKDTETHRVCGCCNQLRPVEDFYKDGKDSHGKRRYRRDCKDCYKTTRMHEDKMKARRK